MKWGARKRWSVATITVVSTITFVQIASAADLPPQPAAAPASTWTGWYAGVNIGGTREAASSINTQGFEVSQGLVLGAPPESVFAAAAAANTSITTGSNTRIIGGGQLGYNWQFTNWVAGFETDIQGFGRQNAETGSSTTNVAFTTLVGFPPIPSTDSVSSITSASKRVDWLGTVRGRVGWLPTPTFLVYATGGLAFGGLKAQTSTTQVLQGPDVLGVNAPYTATGGLSAIRPGWTAGGGFEWMFAPHWSVKGEYLFYDFGNVTWNAGTLANVTTVPFPFSDSIYYTVGTRSEARFNGHIARLGLNYHFAPASATAPLPTDTQRPALPALNANWSVSSNFEARFSTWTGSRGSNTFAIEPGKGTQFYFPETLTLFYQQPGAYRIETNLKAAYVVSNHRALNQDASLNTFVDTQLSSTITFLNNESYRFFLGAALNLPTGRSFLPGNLRFARMDPDLVDIGTYGVGFNANPTAGFIFGVSESTAMSFSAGWAYQGPFTREGVDPALFGNDGFGCFGCVDLPVSLMTPTKIDPGDVFTANMNTSSIFDQWSIKTSFAFMSESHVKVDGIAVGQKGPTFTGNIASTILLDPKWALLLNGSWSFSGKNKIQGPFGGLITETKNSNSHVLIGSVDLSYAVTERLRVAPNYSVLWRNENYYDFIQEQFIPAKFKQSVGLSGTYTVSPTSSVTVRGSRFWVDVHEGPAFTTFSSLNVLTGNLQVSDREVQPSLHYQGWAGAIVGKVTF